MVESLRSIELTGPEKLIRKVKQFVKGETLLDFNKIVPIPKQIDIEIPEDAEFAYWALTGHYASIWSYLDAWLNDGGWWTDRLGISTRDSGMSYLRENNSAALATGKLMRRSLKMHGFAHPDDWREANWGSTENAYDHRGWFGNNITFLTAKFHPSAIVKALSTKFPELSVRLSWASLVDFTPGVETWEAGRLKSVSEFDWVKNPGAMEVLKRLELEEWVEVIDPEADGFEITDSVKRDNSSSIENSERISRYAQKQQERLSL
jgi:hypothetical protein